MAYELINHGPATPHRMHALIRLLARADEWNRGELLDLVEPASLDPKQQAAKDVLTALRNLDLVEMTDGTVRLRAVARELVTLENFRQYLVSTCAKTLNEDHVNYRFS